MRSYYLHKITNHPVHILDENKTFSPSSFIPFCEFGGYMMGVNLDQFPVPVCNSFRAKILYDQLCYEIDLNQFKNNFTAETLRSGFTFFVDKNEDRQFSWSQKNYNGNGKGSFPLYCYSLAF